MRRLGRSAPFAILICAAVYLLALTSQFEFPRAPGRLGPDVWPRAILLLLILICVFAIVCNVLFAGRLDPSGAAGVQGAGEPGDGTAQGDVGPSGYARVLAAFLMFLAYPFALEALGFPIATVLLMALFMVVGGWRSPLGVLATSVLGALVFFYVFRGIVYVSLPLGTGPFRDFTMWLGHLLGMR